MSAKRPYTIEIANQHPQFRIARRQLSAAVRTVLAGEQVKSATVSVAVVDDPTIHQLNRQYLNHDYPTDVLSFLLDEGDGHLEGEVVVSADTAERVAAEYGWSPEAELLLYLVHGTLHLVGYDDHSAPDRAEMRDRERHYLDQLQVSMPDRAAGRPRRRPR